MTVGSRVAAERFVGRRWPWVRLAVVAFFAALTAEGCGDDARPRVKDLPDTGAGGSAIDGGSGGAPATNGGAGRGGVPVPDGGRPPKCTAGAAQCIGDHVLSLCGPDGAVVTVPCG